MNLKNHNGQVFEITYGGLSREDLLKELDGASIKLNEYAKSLFNSELFTLSRSERKAKIVVLSISDLGFEKGASFPELFKAIELNGFSCCPLEIGPYLRLAFLDQKEEYEPEKNKAPKGSITIISKPLKEDDDFPKGFYIRKLDNSLWLRGYVCSMDNIWDKSDRIAVLGN